MVSEGIRTVKTAKDDFEPKALESKLMLTRGDGHERDNTKAATQARLGLLRELRGGAQVERGGVELPLLQVAGEGARQGDGVGPLADVPHGPVVPHREGALQPRLADEVDGDGDDEDEARAHRHDRHRPEVDLLWQVQRLQRRRRSSRGIPPHSEIPIPRSPEDLGGHALSWRPWGSSPEEETQPALRL